MRITNHARVQISRRRVSREDVDFTIGMGLEIHQAGATFYVLRLCDIPEALHGDPDVRRAEGTTVVVEDGTITTVYRNREVGHLKRKPRHGRRRHAA